MPGLSQEQIELDGVPLSLEQVCTVRPVCQRMPAISLSDGVPLTGKIGQKTVRRPGEWFSGTHPMCNMVLHSPQANYGSSCLTGRRSTDAVHCGGL